MARESSTKSMEYLTESGETILKMGLESSHGQMEPDMKDNGLMER